MVVGFASKSLPLYSVKSVHNYNIQIVPYGNILKY